MYCPKLDELRQLIVSLQTQLFTAQEENKRMRELHAAYIRAFPGTAAVLAEAAGQHALIEDVPQYVWHAEIVPCIVTVKERDE